jgi:hypothetical protein
MDIRPLAEHAAKVVHLLIVQVNEVVLAERRLCTCGNQGAVFDRFSGRL